MYQKSSFRILRLIIFDYKLDLKLWIVIKEKRHDDVGVKVLIICIFLLLHTHTFTYVDFSPLEWLNLRSFPWKKLDTHHSYYFYLLFYFKATLHKYFTTLLKKVGWFISMASRYVLASMKKNTNIRLTHTYFHTYAIIKIKCEKRCE